MANKDAKNDHHGGQPPEGYQPFSDDPGFIEWSGQSLEEAPPSVTPAQQDPPPSSRRKFLVAIVAAATGVLAKTLYDTHQRRGYELTAYSRQGAKIDTRKQAGPVSLREFIFFGPTQDEIHRSDATEKTRYTLHASLLVDFSLRCRCDGTGGIIEFIPRDEADVSPPCAVRFRELDELAIIGNQGEILARHDTPRLKYYWDAQKWVSDMQPVMDAINGMRVSGHPLPQDPRGIKHIIDARFEALRQEALGAGAQTARER